MKPHIVCALMFALAAPLAGADTVTWRASGTITNELAYPPGTVPPATGSILEVYFTFDSAAADLSADPTEGVYRNLLSVSFLIGGQTLDQLWDGNDGPYATNPATSSLAVYNDAPIAGGRFEDGVELVARDIELRDPFGIPASPLNQARIRLGERTAVRGDLLTSDAIPGTLDPLLFGVRELEVTGWFDPGNAYFYFAPLETLEPVPLPAAVWLLLSGIAALSLTVRTRPRICPIRQ